MEIDRDDEYRCRLCEKKASLSYNSYFLKMSPKYHIRVCRHCWLMITKYISLYKKLNPELYKDIMKEVEK